MTSQHGEYPFDSKHRIWTVSLRDLPRAAAESFLREVTNTGDLLHKAVPNKGFRVLRSYPKNGKYEVLALYNHDGVHSLIVADEEEFLKADKERHYGQTQPYKAPIERLPYQRFVGVETHGWAENGYNR